MRANSPSRLARFRRASLIAHEGGVAAVEFSLILPILVVLWIGGVEITQALSVDRRLNNLASSIGDLVARSKTLQYGTVDDIFNMAPGAMYPYTAVSLTMRVSAVWIDDDGVVKVIWSRAETGTTPYSSNQNVTNLVPTALRTPDTELIMAEVGYTYTPTVGYVITGSLALDDRMFFVPRLVDKVTLCDNSGQNCKKDPPSS
jgi:Flp pilus assembly protein TadG